MMNLFMIVVMKTIHTDQVRILCPDRSYGRAPRICQRLWTGNAEFLGNPPKTWLFEEESQSLLFSFATDALNLPRLASPDAE